ncbi:hypothetical protein M3Y99_01607600 [Aphelenchoides fujianensis]|nr:hypothetical protein M3Y99_01607600 [Aphelenchoides fujianensis]
MAFGNFPRQHVPLPPMPPEVEMVEREGVVHLVTNIAAPLLPPDVEVPAHPGEWRAEVGGEKGSFWADWSTQRRRQVNEQKVRLAPNTPVFFHTHPMEVNGPAHPTAASKLDSDLSDVHWFTRRADFPPCSRFCLQLVEGTLPLGRFAVCPVHKRLVCHPRPPAYAALLPDGLDGERTVECRVLECRIADDSVLTLLRADLDSKMSAIVEHPLASPVVGGHAVCLYGGELHRCRVEMIGSQEAQVELIDRGFNVALKHAERLLFELPTDIAEMAPALAFRCSLINQDTRLLDFAHVTRFKEAMETAGVVVIEEHDPSARVHYVNLVSPALQTTPTNNMSGVGTRNRQRRLRNPRGWEVDAPPAEDTSGEWAEESEELVCTQINMDEMDELVSGLMPPTFERADEKPPGTSQDSVRDR